MDDQISNTTESVNTNAINRTAPNDSNKSQYRQIKTVQIISRPNSIASSSSNNCVFIQQVPQMTQATSQFNNSADDNIHNNYVQNSSQQNPADLKVIGNYKNNHQFSTQVQAQKTSVHMIQVNNAPYIVNTEKGQRITVQQYIPQKHFVSSNEQNLVNTGSKLDASRPVQNFPSQTHGIQHSVSLQNQSFQLSKQSNVPQINQNRPGNIIINNEALHTPSRNKQSLVMTKGGNREAVDKVENISEPKQKIEFNPRNKKSIGNGSHHMVSTNPPQFESQSAPLFTGNEAINSKSPKKQSSSQVTYQKVVYNSAKDNQLGLRKHEYELNSSKQPSTEKGQEENYMFLPKEQPARTKIVNVRTNPNQYPSVSLNTRQMSIDDSKTVGGQQPLPVSMTRQIVSQKVNPTSFQPSMIINSNGKSSDGPMRSPIPSDPSHSMVNKLNIDLAVGDPKDSYRMLKRHFKYLVYENECYQGHLRDSHQKLLKLERDNNYLMDRLLKYENLSDSDGDESDSSVKTIEDKVVLQKPAKRKANQRTVINPPPKKKANNGIKSSDSSQKQSQNTQGVSDASQTSKTKSGDDNINSRGPEESNIPPCSMRRISPDDLAEYKKQGKVVKSLSSSTFHDMMKPAQDPSTTNMKTQFPSMMTALKSDVTGPVTLERLSNLSPIDVRSL